MTDDKPNVSTTDPDDWRTFIRDRSRERAERMGELQARRLLAEASAGLSAAQEIRLRLVEALLSGGGAVDDGALPVLEEFAQWVEGRRR